MWRGAKAVGSERLRNGGKIVTDISENKSTDVSPKNIVSKHVNVSVQILIGKLRGRGRKRARAVASVTKKMKKSKRARVMKRDISRFTSVTCHQVRYRGRGRQLAVSSTSLCTDLFKRLCLECGDSV